MTLRSPKAHRLDPVDEIGGTTDELISNKLGINLDIGCGGNKYPGFVGMDIRDMPGVDIVHDINVHPWPMRDNTVNRIVCSHLVEHIPPVAISELGTWFPFVAFMDEAWRISNVGCEFMISAPYWQSAGFPQDPTHINPINETTFAYFDPLNHTELWFIYEPKPWYYRYISFDPQGNLEVLLMRHSEDSSKWAKEREGWGPMNLGS